MLHDKHVVKMVLETAQLLSSVHHILPSHIDKTKIYKLTHKNHPSAVWTRYSNLTYNWLIDYGVAICGEYTYRYNKIHKTQTVIDYLKSENVDYLWKETLNQWAEPPKCMPDTYKVDCSVQSYINYYLAEKLNNGPRYTKRANPFISSS